MNLIGNNLFELIDSDYLYEIQGGGWLGLVGGIALVAGGIVLSGTGVGAIIGGKAAADGAILLVTGVTSIVGGLIAIDQS